MRSDIVPGGILPNYELPDHTGKLRKLSELQGEDPLVLTLARGHFCPKEHQQHLELAAFYPRIAVAYTQIATIASVRQSEPCGPSFRTPAEPFRRISTSRSTPTPSTIR
jgi:peroxiredoxin